MSVRVNVWVSCALLAAASCTVVATGADSAVPGKVQSELEGVLAAQDRANANGESAEQLARRFYTDDVAIVGEGDPHAKHGIDAAIVEMTEWMKSLGPQGQRGCHFHLEGPVIASATSASAFVTLTCNANPPAAPSDQVIRQLFVWKRLPQGWRVAMEMWEGGSL